VKFDTLAAGGVITEMLLPTRVATSLLKVVEATHAGGAAEADLEYLLT
jgi:hypothetical protein